MDRRVERGTLWHGGREGRRNRRVGEREDEGKEEPTAQLILALFPF